MGFETHFIAEPKSLRNLGGTRLGWFGICHNSPYRGTQYGGVFSNIFPGQPSGTANPYERNAYGFCGTSYSGDPPPIEWYFNGCTVDGVTSWEGFDFHNAIDCGFINCIAKNCSQGFVFECHIARTMSSLVVEGCLVQGYGESVTRDGLTCYSLAGIVANASGTAGQTNVVRISNNIIRSIGEARPGTQGGGGIVVRQIYAVNINDNVIQDARQAGISLSGGAASPDESVYASVKDNIINRVTTHATIQRGIQCSSRVLGLASGNQVTDIATKAEAFYQVGAPTYVMNFGTIGDGTTTTDVQNIAHGAV
jgi:hypothetical protein